MDSTKWNGILNSQFTTIRINVFSKYLFIYFESQMAVCYFLLFSPSFNRIHSSLFAWKPSAHTHTHTDIAHHTRPDNNGNKGNSSIAIWIRTATIIFYWLTCRSTIFMVFLFNSVFIFFFFFHLHFNSGPIFMALLN